MLYQLLLAKTSEKGATETTLQQLFIKSTIQSCASKHSFAYYFEDQISLSSSTVFNRRCLIFPRSEHISHFT